MPHPFDVICAVLRHRLNGDGLDPAVIAALERGGIDDRRLVAVTSSHRITPALAACLSDLGLDEHLPPELRDYLAFMRESNAARNRAFRDELGEIVMRLNGLGVEPCLVKGAARLVDGLYPDDSWRFMIDLDLLVPGERLGECVNALRGDGYCEVISSSGNAAAKHYPPLVHSEKCAAVELHRHLAPAPYASLLPTHDIIKSAISMQLSTGHVRLLKCEDQIVHLITHSQLFDNYRFYGIIRLSDAVELSLLIKRCGSDLDWMYVIDRFERPDRRRAGLSLLYLTRALLGARIPEQISFDLLTRLQAKRMLGQQRSRSAMVIGMASGPIMYVLHGLKHRPDRVAFLARLAAKPKVRRLSGVFKEFVPRS